MHIEIRLFLTVFFIGVTAIARTPDEVEKCERYLMSAPQEELNENIHRVALPFAGIFDSGLGHIKLPDYLRRKLSASELKLDWEKLKEPVREFDELPPLLKEVSLFLEQEARLSIKRAALVRPGQYLINRLSQDDEGFWHNDIDKARPVHEHAINFARMRLARQTPMSKSIIQITIPLPIDVNPPTVVMPWGGRYAGEIVQAPMGYATAFLYPMTMHRADPVHMPRGLYMLTLKVEPLN